MDMIKLSAEKREIVGRKVNTLRRKKLIPANIFGSKTQSLAVTVKAEDFKHAYDEAGETGLIEIAIGSDKRPTLISNVQIHPVTQEILHIDFRQVDLKEKIMASVPVEITGESPIAKSGEATVVVQLDEIEVEALPADFPESILVDISVLTEVDQAIQVKDLKYDRSKLTIEIDPEQIVVKAEPPQKEEVVAPVAPTEGEEAAPVAAEGEAAETSTEEKTEEQAEA